MLFNDQMSYRWMLGWCRDLKGNAGIFKPGPYFWHEIRSSTYREQFGESRRPSEDI